MVKVLCCDFRDHRIAGAAQLLTRACRRTFQNWAYGRQSTPNSEVASKEAAHESGTIQNISDQPLHNPRALPRLVTLHLGHLSTSQCICSSTSAKVPAAR